MASATSSKSEKDMDAIAPGADEGGNRPQPQPRSEKAGFFTIYKKGQGYWTRMGTVFGAALIGLLAANFLYQYAPVWLGPTGAGIEQAKATQWGIGIAAAFLAVFALLMFWLMNKPDNADFLIATDSEMKKVNWTSKRELIGSTKVVIIFMFLIAGILFVIDVLFGYLFQFIGVLKAGPFG